MDKKYGGMDDMENNMRNSKGQFIKGHKNIGFDFNILNTFQKGENHPMYGKHNKYLKDFNDYRKGKTFEQVYGAEKAILMKSQISKRTTKRNLENNPMKNPEVRAKATQTLIEGYNSGRIKPNKGRLGKKISEEHKAILRLGSKGKTFEERYGMETANRMKNNLSKIHIGKNNSMFGRFAESHPHYGKKMSEETKHRMEKNIYSKRRGKSYEEIFGEERATEIKKIKSAGHQGIPLEQWEKFICLEEYGLKFNKKFKEAIRIRDAFLCLKCNMREEDSLILLKRRLACHHIDYDKQNSIPENCCALCQRCNLEVNANRIHWTKFFQSMLAERYGYKYSEDAKIILQLNEEKLI